LKRSLNNLPALLSIAVLVNVFLIWQGFNSPNSPMGDLPYAYQPWFDAFIGGGPWWGLDRAWVYPFPAFLPMVIAGLVAPQNLQIGWVVLRSTAMISILVSLVTLRVESEEKRDVRYRAAYLWLAFTLALGSVAISRIDSVSVLLAVVGALALVTGSQARAAIWFTVAGWIKIWPIALFLALVAASKTWKRNLLAAAATSAGVLLIGFLFGGNAAMFSFITGQTGRGIQFEAPLATPWVWLGVVGASDAGVFYSHSMMTFEVFGPLVADVAFWATLVQFGALAITAALIFLAYRAKANFGEIVAWGSLTATLDLIVFNKVGSPQFISWLVVPILLGVLYRVPNWRLPSVLILAITLLTQLVYPYLYGSLLELEAVPASVLLLRNIGLILALIVANVMLTRLGAKRKATVETI
jgi:hypothetical protein